MNTAAVKMNPADFFIAWKKEHGWDMLLNILLWNCKHLPAWIPVLAAQEAPGKEGEYYVVFDYMEEDAGVYAARAAVRIAAGID